MRSSGDDDGRRGVRAAACDRRLRSARQARGRRGTAGSRRGLGRRRGAQRPRSAVLHLLEMHQQVGQPAFDRAELAEPGVGGVELLGQLGDAVFQRAERELVALAQLHAVEPLAQLADRAFELRRHGAAAFHQAAMRASSWASASDELSAAARSNLAASPRTSAESCASAPSDATFDTTPRSDTTACSSCLNARGSPPGVGRIGDLIDLVRQRAHRVLEADEAFGRREAAQRVAHLGKLLFEHGEGGAVRAGLPAAVDALGQRADLGFQRFDGAARHRLGQRAADFGEVFAQRAESRFRRAGAASRSAC